MGSGPERYTEAETGSATGRRSRISPGKLVTSIKNVRNLRTFASLKYPTYRLYYSGILGQRAAMNMQMIARSLLIYEITDSPAILGLMSLFNALPILFFAIAGGVIADRIQKKYVLLVGMAISVIITLGVALSLSFGYLSTENAGSWWILAAASFLQGTVMGLMIPSRQSIIPEIVPEEEIMNAVSLDSTGQNTLRLMAPAISGFLIEAFGFGAVYYVMTGMYLIGTICIAFLPLTGKISMHGGNAVRDIREAFHYLKRQRTLLNVLGFTLFVVVLSMPYMTLLPIFALDILNVGEGGMGVLVSVSGAGAMVGSLAIASLPNKKRGLLLIISSLILGGALVAFSFSQVWIYSLVFIIFVGLGQAGRMALGNTLVQYYVDDEYRGRVMSVYIMQFGMTSLGGSIAGLLAEGVGAARALAGFSVLLVLISLLALAFMPSIRKLD